MKKKTGIVLVITSIFAVGFIGVVLVSFKPNNLNDGIKLPNVWKFTIGDNADYAQLDFNELFCVLVNCIM